MLSRNEKQGIPPAQAEGNLFHVLYSSCQQALFTRLSQTAQMAITKSISNSVEGAIEKEKQMKKWERAWKIRLIEERNPEWNDLSEDWGK